MLYTKKSDTWAHIITWKVIFTIISDTLGCVSVADKQEEQLTGSQGGVFESPSHASLLSFLNEALTRLCRLLLLLADWTAIHTFIKKADTQVRWRCQPLIPWGWWCGSEQLLIREHLLHLLERLLTKRMLSGRFLQRSTCSARSCFRGNHCSGFF